MKKVVSILFVLALASSASASIYKWVDERGVVNFTDEYSEVPPDYRGKVEEMKVSKTKSSAPSQAPAAKTTVGAKWEEAARQAPPIAQTLIREGEFAIKLADVLNVGKAKDEAEAENILTSAGIAPKNGWIADYPLTPDIIGELENSIGSAADSGKLGMKKNDAIAAFQGLAAGQGLAVRTDTENQEAEAEPPEEVGEYSTPEENNNYYYDEGPPVITYYRPPWDYYYLYAWVPYPFWCTGFRFPGFFVLRDFHRGFHRHGHMRHISNHFRDPRTGRFGRIDARGRHMGNAVTDMDRSRREFTSREAIHGASSILTRNHGRTRLNRATDGGFAARSPRSPRGRTAVGHSTHGGSDGRPGGFNSHGRGMERSPGRTSGGGSVGFQRSDSGIRGSSRGGGGGFDGRGRGMERSSGRPSGGGSVGFQRSDSGSGGFSRGGHDGGRR